MELQNIVRNWRTYCTELVNRDPITGISKYGGRKWRPIAGIGKYAEKLGNQLPELVNVVRNWQTHCWN